MNRLWSPWRSEYIATFGTDAEYRGCIFCDARVANDDDAHFVVERHETCLTIMNLYPYNSGHILVVPHMHTDSLLDVDDASYHEVTDVVRRWTRVMTETMRPQGFNIGTNIGRASGAGIDQHVHMHIVPRWQGDANFMPVIDDTKVISEDIRRTMQRLRHQYREFYSTTIA